jgi:hypothetical protein
MTRTSIRRVAIAGALATTLTLAAPAHAAGLNHGGAPGIDMLQAAWQWAVSLWTGQPLAPDHVGVSAKPRLKSDLGAAVDPDGTPRAAAAPCQVSCDRSSAIDPNG